MSYLVGSRVAVTVAVKDIASSALVDPGSLTFTLMPPAGSKIAAESTVWNGATWTPSTGTNGAPERVSLGVFKITVTLPWANAAAGRWAVGCRVMPNTAPIAPAWMR